jgi:hypothetical protein
VKARLVELQYWIYEVGEDVLFPIVWNNAIGSRKGLCDFDMFTVDLFWGFVDLRVVS